MTLKEKQFLVVSEVANILLNIGYEVTNQEDHIVVVKDGIEADFSYDDINDMVAGGLMTAKEFAILVTESFID